MSKKKYKKEPSIRIRRVFKKVLDSRGRVSVSQAMREEGYPATTAKNPQQMTRTISWQELLQEYIPDESISKVHKQLLNAFRLGHRVFPLSVEDKDIIELLDSTECTVVKINYTDQGKHVYFWSPDNMARDRALEKALKLKGRYVLEKPPEEEKEVDIRELKRYLKWRKEKKNLKS